MGIYSEGPAVRFAPDRLRSEANRNTLAHMKQSEIRESRKGLR